GWSLSHLHFRTEGFGEFLRLDNTVWRGVLQADISPATRVHLEGREYDSDRLSILNPADPFNYTPRKIDQHQVTWRFGLHQRISDSQELLFVHAADYAKYTIDDLVTPYNPPYAPARRSVRDRVYAPEMQYRYHVATFDFLIGQAYVRAEEDNDYDAPDLGLMTNEVSLSTARAHYGYARWTPLSGLNLELGLARERQQNKSGLNQRLTSPKFGLRWELIPGGTLRLASIRGVNRFQASGATLEPAQVAGFNQFYDDRFSRRTVRRGVAWDQRLAQGVSWGIETSRREIGDPSESATPSYTWWHERQTRAYANWAIPSALLKESLPGWEGALSLSHDRTSYLRPANDTGAEQISDYTPRHLRIGAKLFQASGFEFDLAATKIRDHGTYQLNDFNTFELYAQPFSDSFWVWDAALSYQLPGKRGKITLGGLNLGDRRNSQYLEMDPLAPRFASARYVYGKLLLNF
ncbi:MAG: TonB-dependent receptor, partial [Burkholderiales bacterium]|nr:TonB-dependent receptor [Burkholderiales bacterium]